MIDGRVIGRRHAIKVCILYEGSNGRALLDLGAGRPGALENVSFLHDLNQKIDCVLAENNSEQNDLCSMTWNGNGLMISRAQTSPLFSRTIGERIAVSSEVMEAD